MSEAGEGAEWPEDWLRLNAVCPYYTMFPLDFPLGQLKLYPEARRVLDPFVDAGRPCMPHVWLVARRSALTSTR